jgi:hypothetical protein
METTMSRHWHRVSKPIRQLAAGLYPITTEGMFPYEIYYVLATDEEIQRLSDNWASSHPATTYRTRTIRGAS